MIFEDFMNKNIQIDCVFYCDTDIKGTNLNYTDYRGIHELFFKYPGNNTFTYNETNITVTNSTVGFLPRTNELTKYMVDVIEPCPSINIYIKGDIFSSKKAIFFDCERFPKFKTCFESLLSTWQSKNVGYEAKAKAKLYEIIYLMQKHYTTPYLPQHKFDIIKNSIVYITQNYMLPNFDYRHLAEISNVSYSYYKKIFMAKYNVTPKQYVNNLKLSNACDLLKSHRYSVSQIAEMLGYSSIYYFSHAFSEAFNMSPSEYMKMYTSSESNSI